MKKALFLIHCLFISLLMTAQNRIQPKPGPAPTINIGKPQTFELPNGLKVLVVENHKLPRVSYTLTLDNLPYVEGAKKGVSNLTSSMIGNGTEQISKVDFNEEIDFLGADISFYNSGASGSGLSKYAPRILELLADGALHPRFTADDFENEKSKFLESLKADEKSVPAVARRVENILAYGPTHPVGEFVNEISINQVTLEDVIANYKTYFVPENAYLIIIGDVQLAKVKKQVEKLFSAWPKASAPKVPYADPTDVAQTQINFIDMPNAVQSEISVMNITNLKMSDKDYFAAIVANQVVGGDFNSYLNMNLREKHGWTYGAGSSINASKYTSRFSTFAQVRNAVTDSAVVEVLKELKRIRTEKVADDVLQNVKAGYVGRFVMQIEKPQTVASYALRLRTQNLPLDFYENFIQNINAVTTDDILRVANTYFKADQLRIVITGKGSEVATKLADLQLPIFYFDKYGSPITQKKEARKLPGGLTASAVISTYLTAIGGEKAARAVQSVVTLATGTVQGFPVELTTKTTSNHQQVREIKAMGMTMMKQVVNDKNTYVLQQGQKVPLSATEIAALKAAAVPFEELDLLNKKTITLKGIESFNETDCYVVQDGANSFYFACDSGLKLGESKTVETKEGDLSETTYFSEYKAVNGLQFPHKTLLNIGMEIELITTEIKLNESIPAADFQ
ncbi:MAG: insulinase family protein [Flavobacterium psychrophilum]